MATAASRPERRSVSGHGYRRDLAWIHDRDYSGLARDAAPAILALLARHGWRSGRIVELGCGGGVLARALADRGHDVLGIDQSKAMVALARRRAPGARFATASLWRVRIPPAVAVLSIGECLSYRMDRRAGPPSVESLFRRVYRALVPGGLWIFDLVTPGRERPGIVRELVQERDDYFLAVRASVVERGRSIRREITTFRREGARWRRDREVHELWVADPAWIRWSLQRCGFRVATRPRYGRLPLPRGTRIFVACKAAPGRRSWALHRASR